MCGFLGWVGNPAVDVGRLKAALRAIGHRGPDGSGEVAVEVSGARVHLAHVRLAIQDLSEAGAQPMVSSDGRWWVSFNGEIYNHLHLRDRDRTWRGTSDTETLVELLAERGIDHTLASIDGMFGFAAVDRVAGRLYLVRDRFGIKPVYYTDSGPLAFGSEIRALRALGLVDGTVDPDELQAFLALRYVPAPGTIWRGVKRLAAGHVLAVDLATGERTCRWFDVPTRERFAGSFEAATAEWRDILRGAVQRQLLSDVPVGVLLSGGVDSALVAAMARDAAGNELPTFTVGFGDGSEACELEDARATAALLGLPHHAVEVTPGALLDDFEAIVRSVEEPLGTTSSLAYWQLTRVAREHVTVALTGQGADEPLGGYRRYQLELWREWMGAGGVVGPAARAARGLAKSGASASHRALWALGERGDAERLVHAGALFLPPERRALTTRADAGAAVERLGEWLQRLDGAQTSVEHVMAVDTRAQLADDLLLYGDKVSMAHALEVRVPLLDLAAVRFLESLPRAYKIGHRQGKRVHKAMAEQYLPPAVVHRPKRGFKVPYDAWVRGPWRERMGDYLLGGGGPLGGVLDRGAIEALWTSHQAGRRDATREIFALASLSVLLHDARAARAPVG